MNKQQAFVETFKPDEGRKDDKEKLMYDLIDPLFLEELALVLTKGAAKYQRNNWKKVDNAKSRYTDALIRHLQEWRKGNINDIELNTHHMANIACNAMFLYWFDKESK